MPGGFYIKGKVEKVSLKGLEDRLDSPVSGLAALKALIDTVNGKTDTLIASQLFCTDFWSEPQEEVSVASAPANKALPGVTVADLPAGATVVRALAMFKFRMVENTSEAGNRINGAQHIQVRDDTPGTFTSAISIPDNLFTIAAVARESGDVMIGDHDIAAEVDGNDTYNFQWTGASADQDNLNFNDVQTGLRIWYSL